MSNTWPTFVKSDRPNWGDTWFTVAETIAKRSLCHTQVGAVITTKDNRPVSVGYNGPPKGFHHLNHTCNTWCARGAIPRIYQETGQIPDVSYDDCPSLHAEQNALITADKTAFAGGRIYVTSHICGTCAKLIANSGLHHVFVNDTSQENYDKRNSDEWYEFLRNCSIGVILTGMPAHE